MPISNKIKFIMSESKKSRTDIAEALQISEAAVSNKLYRDSFDAEDLIKIADCVGYQLAFFNEDNKIELTLKDIREKGG